MHLLYSCMQVRFLAFGAELENVSTAAGPRMPVILCKPLWETARARPPSAPDTENLAKKTHSRARHTKHGIAAEYKSRNPRTHISCRILHLLS